MFSRVMLSIVKLILAQSKRSFRPLYQGTGRIDMMTLFQNGNTLYPLTDKQNGVFNIMKI